MNQRKPRIAFCFSGQARTLDQTYLFFQENLFDTAKKQGFDYDVFCVVEDDDDVDKINLLNPTEVEKIKSSEVEKIIDEKYGDFKWLYDYYYVLYNNSRNQLKKSITNYLQQYYKVKKSIEMKKHFEETQSFLYDIVIRLRFDIKYNKKRNFKEILKGIHEQNILCCKLTDRKFTLCPIGDFFFIGNSRIMDLFGSYFDNFKYSFIGHEIRKIYVPISIIMHLFDKFNYICNNNVLTNYLIRFMAIINTKLFFNCYCVELMMYEYLNYYNILVDAVGFNSCLIRKNNVIELYNGGYNNYEI